MEAKIGGFSLGCKREDPLGGNTQRQIYFRVNRFLTLKKKKKKKEI